jgi:hypothetical protein
MKVLSDLKTDISKSFEFIYSEFDRLKRETSQKDARIKHLEELTKSWQKEITEVKAWAKWDEVAHMKMTERMINDGVTMQDLFEKNEDIMKKYIDAEDMIDYYGNLDKRDPLFSKPFKLFSGQMQIGLTERINLLEREAIKYYKDKSERVRNEQAEYEWVVQS